MSPHGRCHVGGHAGEDRRSEEAATVEGRPGQRAPPATTVAPLVTASATWRCILSMRRCVDERSDGHAVLESVAGAELLDPARKLGDEAVGDRSLDEDPVRADAGLPGVEELHQGGAPGGMFRVGIVEHDERRVPAELERHPLHVLGGAGGDLLPTSVEPVKLILRTAGLVDELVADRRRVRGGDQVDDAGREAGVVEHAERLHRAQAASARPA